MTGNRCVTRALERIQIPGLNRVSVHRRVRTVVERSIGHGAIALSWVALFLASGCREPVTSNSAYRIQLSLTGSDTLRSQAEDRVLEAVVSNAAGVDQPEAYVEFSVDKPDVLSLARVSASKVTLRAVADGEALVTASIGQARVSRKMVVRRRVAKFRLSVLGIPDAASLSVGGIVALDPIVLDSLGYPMAVPGGITLTTGDSNVAYLNTRSLVTALVAGGTTVIGRLSAPESVWVARWDVSVFSFPQLGVVVRATATGFLPDSVSISAGQYVTWLFPAGVVHNVVFDRPGAPATLADVAAAQDTSVMRVFGSGGSIRYRCTLHAGEFGVVNAQ